MKTETMEGVERIARERARQMGEEGWTPEHDDEHTGGSLATAAACYALPPACVHVRRQVNSSPGIDSNAHSYDFTRPGPGQVTWPWAPEWYKRTPADRIRELEKAGALIAAEIDRLLRAEADPDA